MILKKIEKNTRGEDYVVGDIHGCFSLLQRELNKKGFDPNNGDRLFAVGDLVDRGPESHLAKEWLEYSWFYSVLGNHEQMLIDFAYDDIPAYGLICNGGQWIALESKDIVFEYTTLFKELPVAIELETEHGILGIVHADVPKADWNSFKDDLLYYDNIKANQVKDHSIWNRSRIDAIMCMCTAKTIENIDAVAFGHTVLDDVVVFKNSVYIDTGAVFGSKYKFTVLTVEEVFDLIFSKSA